MKNKRFGVSELTLNAMFMAITIVLSLVPFLGMISIGVISITTMHIPVIVAGIVLGWKGGLINGIFFGLASMYIAATRPVGLLDVLFVNPIVAVLPRALFGLSVGLLSDGLKRITRNNVVSSSITAVVSTLLHAVFVLSILYFVAISSTDAAILEAMPSNVWIFLGSIASLNTALEVGIAVLIGVPVSLAIQHAQSNR